MPRNQERLAWPAVPAPRWLATAQSRVVRPALAAVLPGLSAQQLAGQRVIYSYPGLTPPSSLLSLIRHGQAAGVIFFGQNISSEAQIAGVIRQLDGPTPAR